MSDLLASYPGARLQPLAGDASTRSFFRLHLPDGSTRVVMDYGAPFQGEPDDVILSRIFLAASLPLTLYAGERERRHANHRRNQPVEPDPSHGHRPLSFSASVRSSTRWT